MAKKLLIENIENPAVRWEEGSVEGYTDKTSDAVAWFNYGEQVADYWFVLGKIKAILIPKANPNYPTLDFTGWNNLTHEEKIVISKCIYAPYALRMTLFTDSQDIENANLLLEKSYGIQKQQLFGRLKIVEQMRRHVFINYVRKGLMLLDTSKQFGKDTSIHLDNFERFATSDFYNWLNNIGEYESNGFAQKAYYADTIKNELNEIYNGE